MLVFEIFFEKDFLDSLENSRVQGLSLSFSEMKQEKETYLNLQSFSTPWNDNFYIQWLKLLSKLHHTICNTELQSLHFYLPIKKVFYSKCHKACGENGIQSESALASHVLFIPMTYMCKFLKLWKVKSPLDLWKIWSRNQQKILWFWTFLVLFSLKRTRLEIWEYMLKTGRSSCT